MKKAGMTLAILVWYGLTVGKAPAEVWAVPAGLWEKPRSGAAVLGQPAARIELARDLKLNQNLHVELMLPLAVNSRSGQGERIK